MITIVYSGRSIDSAIAIAKSAAGFRGRTNCAGIRAVRAAAPGIAKLTRLKKKSRADTVNDLKTNSGKDGPVNGMKNETMPAKDQRRELIPVVIAGIVAAIGLFCLWSDLRDDSLARGDGMITSAVVSRAGAIATPSEPPTRLVIPQTTSATEPSTVGRAAH